VRLFTRNGHDWTSRYPLIVEAALKNRTTSFVVDGGVDGISDFNGLHPRPAWGRALHDRGRYPPSRRKRLTFRRGQEATRNAKTTRKTRRARETRLHATTCLGGGMAPVRERP